MPSDPPLSPSPAVPVLTADQRDFCLRRFSRLRHINALALASIGVGLFWYTHALYQPGCIGYPDWTKPLPFLVGGIILLFSALTYHPSYRLRSFCLLLGSWGSRVAVVISSTILLELTFGDTGTRQNPTFLPVTAGAVVLISTTAFLIRQAQKYDNILYGVEKMPVSKTPPDDFDDHDLNKWDEAS